MHSEDPKMFKPLLTGLAMVVGSLTLSGVALADYPERNIKGTIQWGAGGATDNVARSLTPHAEDALDATVVLTNRPGGTGVIGMNYVMQQRPDGYNLLYGAENPQLYRLMGLADFGYDDMHAINIIGQGQVVIAAPADSPYDDFSELLEAAHQEPGTLRMGGTGAGGLPSTVHAMVNAVDSLDVRTVIESLPEVPPITQALPKIESFLPWGPFWGVFVRKDTPDDIKATLEDAYRQAVDNEEFQTFLDNFGGEPLNLQGKEAQQYLDNWQSVTAWSMYDAEAVETSPEELGIPRP
jgi:tripartite-type tricarboxylate transporter receptor subunit TctC